jgi:outer membrane protein assembly factor BamB
MKIPLSFLGLVLFAQSGLAQGTAPPPAPLSVATTGWRGDGTGKYPDATPPLEWGRVSKSMKNLTWQIAKPAPSATKAEQSLAQGFVTDWLVLGPIPLSDADAQLDAKQLLAKEFLPNEAQFQPTTGEARGSLTWKALRTPDSFVDFTTALGEMENHVVYLHAYLHSPVPARLALALRNSHPVSLWLNGKKLAALDPGSNHYTRAPIPVDLVQGWNRLLLRLAVTDDGRCFFRHRLWAREPTEDYETRNIVWICRLPNRCVSQPVLVGDRIFLNSSPYDLVCVNKKDGKILWTRPNSSYEAASEGEKQAHPEIFRQLAELASTRDRIDAAILAGPIPSAKEMDRKFQAQAEMDKLMAAVDPNKYRKYEHDGGLFSSPTPCSDGRRVYAKFGHGVTACYDLDGRRQWIQTINYPLSEHGFVASPVLAGGRVIINLNHWIAYDAATGTLAWQSNLKHKLWYSTPAVIRVGETEALLLPNLTILAAHDGREIFDSPVQHNSVPSPTVEGRRAYLPVSTGAHLRFELPASEPEAAKDKKPQWLSVKAQTPVPGFGGQEDCLSSSSLYHKGLAYVVSASGILTVVDVENSQGEKATVVYQKNLGLDSWGLSAPYPWWCGVGCSPTLAGRHIFIMGNSGRSIVFEPGREFKVVGWNKIEYVVREQQGGIFSYTYRYWPEHQEAANSTPVFEGTRLFFRAEFNLYCIGR